MLNLGPSALLSVEAMAVALFEEDGKPPPEEISEELKAGFLPHALNCAGK